MVVFVVQERDEARGQAERNNKLIVEITSERDGLKTAFDSEKARLTGERDSARRAVARLEAEVNGLREALATKDAGPKIPDLLRRIAELEGENSARLADLNAALKSCENLTKVCLCHRNCVMVI